jgi:hypothetical protein
MRSCYLREEGENIVDSKVQGYHGAWITSLDQILNGFILEDEFLLHSTPHNLQVF